MSNLNLNLLTTGQGIFETIKYSEETLWFWERHLKRMLSSLSLLYRSISETEINSFVFEQLLNVDKNTSYRFKLIALFPFSDSEKTDQKVEFQSLIIPLPVESKYNQHYSLKIYPSPYANNNFFSAIKSINYGHHFYYKNKANCAGFNDVLFIDSMERILEASTSNIFGMIGSNLYTPPLSQNILPGVIRNIICDYFNVEEREIFKKDLSKYDSFFITNSINEITLIRQIENYKFLISGKNIKQFIKNWNEIKLTYKQIPDSERLNF